jgi:hypothetical protein
MLGPKYDYYNGSWNFFSLQGRSDYVLLKYYLLYPLQNVVNTHMPMIPVLKHSTESYEKFRVPWEKTLLWFTWRLGGK